MTYLLFPEERAVFGVDFVHAARFPGNLAGDPVEDHLQALDEMNALDFDILIQGHGNPGTRSDLPAYMGFLETLRSEVSAAIAAGQGLEEARESVLLSDYSNWSLYEERRASIVGEMYALLSEE
jgi:glyoxylase-like metal-dependent hydrolase (beta-lactamase superfamily II)